MASDPSPAPHDDPQDNPAPPVAGDWHLFAPDGYVVTKVQAVLGGIEIEDDGFANAKVGDTFHLNIRDAEVAAVQYRRNGTKRITIDASDFKATVRR